MQFSSIHRQCGFSLLELSIVLVITAILAGGVLTGQSMVESSRLNSVISDVKRFSKAIDDFQDQYHGFPGDLADVTVLTQPLDTSIQASAGDGDGYISSAMTTNDNAVGNPNTSETSQVWLQLQLAGFISGNFNALYDDCNPSINGVQGGIAGSLIQGDGYMVYQGAVGSVAQGQLNIQMFHLPIACNTTAVFKSGGGWSLGSLVGIGLPDSLGALTAEKAHIIDNKIDDGIPSTGIVTAVDTGGTGSCSVVDLVTRKVTYAFNSTTHSCIVDFLISKTATPPSGAASTNTCLGGAPVGASRVNTALACPSGYNGDIIDVCDINGNWVPIRQTCTPIQCSGGLAFGQTRQFPCPEGWSGTITQVCQISGIWKNQDPAPCTPP